MLYRMTHHNIALLASVLFLAGRPAAATNAADSDTPADYAYALAVRHSGKQALVAVRLPPALYLNARAADLADLRVFDAKGVAQPYALQQPPAETTLQRNTRPLSIFPLRTPNDGSGSDAGVDLDIRTRSDGSVVSVNINGTTVRASATAATATAPAAGKLSGLLLDLGPADKDASGAPERVAALRFTAPTQRASYNAEVWLEVSDDLKRWQTVGAADIGWITNSDAQTLHNDRLDFPPQSFRYARLTWHAGEPVEFPAISAEYVGRQTVVAARDSVWLQPEEGYVGGDLTYRGDAALPVDRIDLRFSEANVVYPMTLGRYVERTTRKSGQTWDFVAEQRATFYKIGQEDGTRHSTPLALDAALARQHQGAWVIRPQNARATARPELGLSWQPATLIFLAGGMPPYQLSFGRNDVTTVALPLAQVAPGFSEDDIRHLESAPLGELQTVNAQAAADSPAQRARQNSGKRALTLWALLVLGVVVLAGMTWKLLKQIKDAEPPADT